MEIKNKYNIGEVIYYPTADLRTAKVLKSKITGVLVTEVDDELTIVYQTGGSYGVAQEDAFKTAKPAKKRLVKIMKEKKEEIDKDIENAIKTVKDRDIKELVVDTTEDEEEESEE
jgi:hypothetical protein